MRDAIKGYFESSLVRQLEMNPSHKPADVVSKVLRLYKEHDLTELDISSLKQHLLQYTKALHQGAAINPIWLAKFQDMQFHFFLVNSHAGWLRRLVEQTDELKFGISNYLLYGVYDSLLVLCGTAIEAKDLLEKIQATTFHECITFSARSVPFYRRFYCPDVERNVSKSMCTLINQLVMNYDESLDESNISKLKNDKVILGPTWTFDLTHESRVTAFVGLSLEVGAHGLTPSDVLDSLLHHDILKECLFDLYELDKGYPFHYLAKICCNDMRELDIATLVIGTARVGRVGMDSNTFIVASGKEYMPLLGQKFKFSKSISLNLQHIEDVTAEMAERIGDDAVVKFNNLNGSKQLVILRSLDELFKLSKNHVWDEERNNRIQSAINVFAQSCLEETCDVSVAPVMEIATTVEKYVKHTLKKIIEAHYGKDYSLAQNELKLPTINFRKLTLGKAVIALKNMREHQDFHKIAHLIEEDWLYRLEAFTDVRNRWTHGSVSPTLTIEMVIDEARRSIVAGIELIRWLGGKLIPVAEEILSGAEAIIELQKTAGREPHIFISYSDKDKEMAEKLAYSLKAVSKVFYADWAIKGGESIVGKINEAIEDNDTFFVLLSQNSVNSVWVSKELNSVLMKQLNNHDVKVIPILIEECEVPAMLADIKYIDMTGNFTLGLIELLKAIEQNDKRPSK